MTIPNPGQDTGNQRDTVFIDTIELEFGSADGGANLSLGPGRVNLVVGPNNSGKSLLLRELRNILVGGGGGNKRHIIRHTAWKPVALANVSGFTDLTLNADGTVTSATVQRSGGRGRGLDLRADKTNVDPANPLIDTDAICRQLAEAYNCDGRLKILTGSGSLDFEGSANDVLTRLHRNQKLRSRWRNLVYEGVGIYPALSQTRGDIKLRFSDIEPNAAHETSSTIEAFHYFKGMLPPENVGDGVLAYAGLLAEVISTEKPIILIDEPELFLAPSLAKRLGATLASIAREREGHFFCATHSADFLMGMIQAAPSATVLRIMREQGRSKAVCLDTQELHNLMRDPLVRSTEFLEALFHPSAIICEHDHDRAFYQEIAWRLSESGEETCHSSKFIGVYGKNVLHRVSGPLRKMHVPTAVVVDLDIIKNNAGLPRLLRECEITEGCEASMLTLRSQVANAASESGIDLRQVGIHSLDKARKSDAEKLIRDLAEHGVFLVDVGELERWLSYLGVQGKTPRWLVEIFDKMGTDPKSPAYLKPEKGDVWDFMRGIGNWLANPNRKGMPT